MRRLTKRLRKRAVFGRELARDHAGSPVSTWDFPNRTLELDQVLLGLEAHAKGLLEVFDLLGGEAIVEKRFGARRHLFGALQM